MKSVLISIQPKWCELIASGEKTIEVRKTKPKLETPFKVYIYETQGRYEDLRDCRTFKFWDIRQKVIGEFVCNRIYEIGYDYFYPCGYEVSMGEISRKELYEKSCLSFNQMDDYLNMELGYGWHISNLVIYDKPRELSEFKTLCYSGCENCKYKTIENSYCGGEELVCTVGNRKPITRPFQSWGYVYETDT